MGRIRANTGSTVWEFDFVIDLPRGVCRALILKFKFNSHCVKPNAESARRTEKASCRRENDIGDSWIVS